MYYFLTQKSQKFAEFLTYIHLIAIYKKSFLRISALSACPLNYITKEYEKNEKHENIFF